MRLRKALGSFRRRFFRLSLRSFLLLTTAVAVLLGYHTSHVRHQRHIVQQIRSQGGFVAYELDKGPMHCARFARSLLSESLFDSLMSATLWNTDLEDHFHSVVAVDFSRQEVPVEMLAWISELPRIRKLSLFKTGISDEHVECFLRMPQLEVLFLNRNRITDKGLASLSQLPKLRRLQVGYQRDVAPITDKGVAQLAALKMLESLDISESQVTGTGFAAFPCENKLEYLNIQYTPFRDAELLRLADFSSLRTLATADAELSDAAKIEFQKRAPQCRVVPRVR